VVLTGSVSGMMSHFREVSAAAGGAASAGVSAGTVVGGSINMFSNFPEGPMMTFVIITLTIITISNILAARIVGGGDRYMYYFYAAIFCTLTGLVLLITPIGVHMFFSPEGLQAMGGAGKAVAGATV
jgi:flagellar protein FlaJ